MATLHIYSNRHIGEQVSNIEKGDWIYLENSLSKNRWLLFFKYKNIDESKLDVTYITKDQFFELRGTGMKFDVIVGNPPYQMVTNGNSNPIWHNFVLKSVDLLKEGGYLNMIHPAGWRNVDGRFSDVHDILLSKQMEYLEIHNEKDGQKTFGASTRYDWYTIQNIDRYKNTIVRFEDGTIEELDLRQIPFIPNHSYDRVKSLIAQEGEERVNVLYSRSAYGTDKKNTSKQKTEEFKYPVAYHVSKNDGVSLKWSSTNQNGHFKVPKIIWGNSARTGFHLDINGEYGLTQFTYGLVDSPENLEQIIKVLDENYDEISSMTNVVGSGINHKVISTFRKDFWKEFV